MKELVIETIETCLETHPMIEDSIEFDLYRTQDNNLLIDCDSGEQYVVTVCRIR